jgi:asparagine synthetase B (glutamine-hydrolysing)
MTSAPPPKSALPPPQGASTIVEIEGSPVYGGEPLCAENAIFSQLHAIEQFAKFARRIRGPFSIIVRQKGFVTAVTDFGACFPIYWIKCSHNGAIYVASHIDDLRKYSRCELSARAIYWWIIRGGAGPDPFYSDINLMQSGMVMQIFEDADITSAEYIDFNAISRDGPETFEAAKDRFVEIATSYIAAVSKPENRIACFLSGGTDSAITAYLAKLAGVNVVCLTADYAFSRYSELEAASHVAEVLEVEHRTVRVNYRTNRAAMYRMNMQAMDVPASHSQLTSVVALGNASIELGLGGWLTGSNAEWLFLEFDSVFRGLPTETRAFAEAMRRIDCNDYLARLGGFGSIDKTGAAVLDCFGFDRTDCEAWLQTMENNVAEASRVFEPLGYPLAMQADLLRSAGITHQNCWLPAQRAVGSGGQILSPFLDIEMIQFALSFPLHLRYRDGIGKWFLREFLREETGLAAPKISSPNPSRVWWWFPRPDDLLRVDPRLRNLLMQQQVRNVLKFGGCYKKLFDLTALGIWLNAQALG